MMNDLPPYSADKPPQRVLLLKEVLETEADELVAALEEAVDAETRDDNGADGAEDAAAAASKVYARFFVTVYDRKHTRGY